MEEKEIIVYQANPLIEGVKYDNLEENRLFLACLQKVVPHLPNSLYFDKTFKEVTISAEELIKLFGNDVYYERLKKVAEKMLGKYIFVENKNKGSFEGYTVFSRIKFDSKKGGLTFKFNDDMKPLILELYNIGYTRENLRELFQLSSNYGLRILELLLQYRGCAKDKIIHRTFSVEKLRKLLMVPEGAYAKTNVFLPFVIKKPIEEINIKTRYKITFNPIRTGRKTTDVEFLMILPEDDALPLNISNFIPRDSYGLYQSLTKLGVSEKVIASWIRQEDREMLNLIEELAVREDMTAKKLVGGMKRKGWIRQEYDKRILENQKKENMKRLREGLRDELTRAS